MHKAPVQVGLIGSQFISSIHAESLLACPHAQLAAVASPTPGNARRFAARFDIPLAFTDYRELLAQPGIQMVVVGVPNHLHCQVVLDAAAAGKHIVIEKPFCLSLAEADRMIGACRSAGVKLMYAEELCFAPKYVRLTTDRMPLISGMSSVPVAGSPWTWAAMPSSFSAGCWGGHRSSRYTPR